MIRDSDRTAMAGGIAVLLSTWCVSPLIKPGWLVTTVLAIAAVVGSGMLLRRVTDRWGWVCTGQLLSLFVALTLLVGGIPGIGGVTLLLDLVDAGFAVTHSQAAPVDASTGVVLITAAGFALLALAVDLFAVAWRSPALAGLPLLAAYALAVSLTQQGVAWPRFAAPAAGFLVLLAVGSGGPRRSWGRTLQRTGADGTVQAAGTDTVALLGRDGRRVGAAALTLALVVPPLIPQIGTGLFGGGSGTGSGEGARVAVVNPILNLRQDLNSPSDDVVIRYTTSAQTPGPLRIVTDDLFDGTSWSPRKATLQADRKVQAGLAAPPGLASNVPTRAWKATIEVGRLRQTYLPLPYPARKVAVEGNWLYDPETLNVVGVRTNTQGLTYTVDYLEVLPSSDRLEAAGPASVAVPPIYFSLPDDLPAVVTSTARTVAGDSTSPYEQAVALQKWFREPGNFTYTTNAPEVGENDSGSESIAAFLQQREGYCVHFASAMSVMARTLGIPARVAVGFLPGIKNPDGEWEISLRDAHAWPELYFQGTGWVRFEPTPASRTGTAPGYTAPFVSSTEDDPAATEAPDAAATAPAVPQGRSADQAETTDTADAGSSSGFRVPWWLVTALVLVLVLAASPLLAATLSRRRRARRAAGDPALRAEAAWDDLTWRLSDLGFAGDPASTPRAVQSHLIEEFGLGGSERAALSRLVKDLEAAVFGPAGGMSDARPWGEASRDVGTVVDGVAATRSGRVRRRARWFPASGLALLGALLGGSGGEVAVDRIRRRREAVLTDVRRRVGSRR